MKTTAEERARLRRMAAVDKAVAEFTRVSNAVLLNLLDDLDFALSREERLIAALLHPDDACYCSYCKKPNGCDDDCEQAIRAWLDLEVTP